MAPAPAASTALLLTTLLAPSMFDCNVTVSEAVLMGFLGREEDLEVLRGRLVARFAVRLRVAFRGLAVTESDEPPKDAASLSLSCWFLDCLAVAIKGIAGFTIIAAQALSVKSSFLFRTVFLNQIN